MGLRNNSIIYFFNKMNKSIKIKIKKIKFKILLCILRKNKNKIYPRL